MSHRGLIGVPTYPLKIVSIDTFLWGLSHVEGVKEVTLLLVMDDKKSEYSNFVRVAKIHKLIE